MRRRFIQDSDTGELIEVGDDYMPELRADIHIIPDLPGYESPTTGLWVEGRKQRREDLKRSGCRPWEGMEQEKKEAAKQRAYIDQHLESRLHENVMRTFHELPPEKRRILRSAG